MSWLQGYGWVIGFIVAAALALGGLAAWRTVRWRPATPVPGAAARRQVDLTFAAAVLVTLAVGLAAVLWLLAQAEQVPIGKDRVTVQADAVRTGAAIALGTGGAAYLLLAYRRQRLDEVDTRERRITELYTKAVEQLGHEKAPVRLGALYSLERLAQNNPEHRQTVIDVFCAYLRMPYSLPTQNEPGIEQVKEAATSEDQNRAPRRVVGHDPAQEELQVRQTAQRILAAHLQLPPGVLSAAAQRRQPSPRRAFWPGISLDLTGATLVDFDFGQVSVVQGWFDGAVFQGIAGFDGATFQRRARFDGAIFQGIAGFKATFQGGAGFRGATFQKAAWFDGATFQSGVWFGGATFQKDVGFDQATFEGSVWFSGATFRRKASFDGAIFQGIAGFKATFKDSASFDGAIFQGNVRFGGATFQGKASFDGTIFQGKVSFRGTIFTSGNEGMGLAGARVLHMDNPDLNKRRVWPDGWTVRPDPAHPSHGTLVLAEQAEEPEPAAPPLDPTGR